MNKFYKKTDKYYMGLMITLYISIPLTIVCSLMNFGFYNQESIFSFVVYPIIIFYIVYLMFDLCCSFEISSKIVKIRLLSKVLVVDTLDNVLFYDAGMNGAGSCNIFIEIDDKFYNMHIKKDEYIRFKYFAKNNNIEFLYENDFMAKQKKKIRINETYKAYN